MSMEGTETRYLAYLTWIDSAMVNSSLSLTTWVTAGARLLPPYMGTPGNAEAYAAGTQIWSVPGEGTPTPSTELTKR